MGFFDRFRKEEHTHFERDNTGRVTNVYRDGVEGKSSDELLDEYKQSHPSRFQSWKSTVKRERQERRYERDMFRSQEKQAYEHGLQKGRLKRAETSGFERGFGRQRQHPPQIIKVYQRQKPRKKNRSSSHHHQVSRPLRFDFMTGQWR